MRVGFHCYLNQFCDIFQVCEFMLIRLAFHESGTSKRKIGGKKNGRPFLNIQVFPSFKKALSSS
ncbi:hypothetical protein CDL12_23945 [Handroanthus impetiginosus]|uniref:Uncharacterized protein n=1 Tax=Handroanthus impetiginosus TaxID=429701 RepID=A0A2G9GE06_9LAMI|nr:hypothetical protein CDL12_23945 [Handroanthus impetiginosus]